MTSAGGSDASIGGLLAARVLSEGFEESVLLERDAFPAAAENRKGVPQGRHPHALLAGVLALEQTERTGLVADSPRARVVGARFASRQRSGGAPEQLDTTGRGSRLALHARTPARSVLGPLRDAPAVQ